MSPLRRSGRQRAPNQRFTEDASRLLEELDSGTENEQAEEAVAPVNAADAQFPDVDNNPESASDMAFEESGESEAASPEVASVDSEGADIDMSDVSSPARVSRRKRSKLTSQAKRNSADVLHNRGMGVSNNKVNRLEEVVQMLAGSDRRDQHRLKSTIQYWYNDVSMPSREDIAWGASEDGLLTARKARPEAGDDDPWAWYDQVTVRGAIQKLQPTHRITPGKAQAYYPARLPMHKVVMGPHWQQTLFELRLGEPLHLTKAWRLALDSNAGESAPTGPSIELERNGWIINLGAKIQSLAWAPNHDEDTQYLAVALDQPDPKRSVRQSAFDPTRAYKSSIQIWQFEAREADDLPKGLDPGNQPVLAKIICTEWGMCKEIKWCPVPKSSDNEADGKSHLGLMATVWSDGYVRVLDIAISGIEGHVKYDGALFESKPPQTICTTVTWSSPIDLIAGCSDGKIAIWDILKHLQEHIEFTRDQDQDADQTEDNVQENLANPSPYFNYHLHDSYILAAHACLPYYRHLLITASIDGFYRLCDLRNPDFDTVESHRYRLHPSTFEYCPYLNTAIAPDGFDAVHFLSLRRFFTEQELGWCDGRILTIGCGRAHTCLLLGSADGSVLAMNVVPRIVKERSNPQKYEVIWFKHEWRPESESESMFGEKTQPRPGISRITEAFAPRLKSSNKHADNKKTAVRDSGARTWETIHEEHTAITQLEWNPVPRCGGWAAAGMGSGLLRVEDLAVSP